MGNRERGQDKSTEQGQPRIVPDRAGWWWASESGLNPEMRRVLEIAGELCAGIGSVGVPVSDPVFDWLAPIPGPAVLAALAEYTATIYAIDNAPVDSEERDEAFEDWEASRSKLHAAIRAERDAERDGGA